MKIREFADSIHVSTTTVIRFCKKVGCNGFTEFKIKYRLYLQNQESQDDAHNISLLMDFFTRIDTPAFYEKVDRIAKLAAQSDSVIFTGIGTSGILAHYAARYFTNMGKVCFCIEDPFYPIIKAMLGKTIVFILSESGETQQTLQHAHQFREGNCYIVAITNREDCTLVKLADESFHYYVPTEKSYDFYNITTQIPPLFILETLGKKMKQYLPKIITFPQ